MHYIFLLTMAIMFFAHDTQAKTAPVVIELFTSQSCSSCPPADRLLAEIQEEHDNVIALSCHVTYWNYLHWEDTLSQDFCTQRQRDYAHAMNLRSAYTPQSVVNGHYEMVGSRSFQVNKAIDKAQGELALVNMSVTNDNQLTIDLPNLPTNEYRVSLFAYKTDHRQQIPSGENRGRTIDYTNPVTDLQNLANWNGKEETRTFDLKDIKKSDGYALIIQDKHLTIKAAGKIPLN